LRYRVGIQNPGERAKLDFVRDGQRMTGEMIFALPPEMPARDERTLTGSHPLNGVTIANLSPRFSEEIGLNPLLTGVAVTDVSQGSFAYRSRLRRGFRILSVNGVRITSAAELQREVSKPAAGWTIDVDRGDRVIAWRVGR
jgi:S1-C subfamily serine protease